MKQLRRIVLLLLCCLLLSGCQLMQELGSTLTDNMLSIVADKAAETGADALTRQFIDGILSNDPEKSHAVFVPGVEMEQVIAVFPQFQANLPDVDAYTLTPTHWSSNTENGVTMHAFQFHLTMADETFIVETLQMGGVEGLYNINISPLQEAAGSAVSADSPPAAEIAFLLLTLAIFALMLWALIDCCRHHFKRRWLWVLLILFANLLLTFTLDGGKLHFQFSIGLYLTENQLVLTNSGFLLRMMVPLGAIIYLCRRKRLHAPARTSFAEAFEQPAAETPQEENHEPEEV